MRGSGLLGGGAGGKVWRIQACAGGFDLARLVRRRVRMDAMTSVAASRGRVRLQSVCVYPSEGYVTRPCQAPLPMQLPVPIHIDTEMYVNPSLYLFNVMTSIT